MTRSIVALGLLWFVGSTLLLAEIRWIRRLPLVERLAPYTPGSPRQHRDGALSIESFRDVVRPLALAAGSRTARLFGVGEDVGRRLRRAHSPVEVEEFRLRQFGMAGAGFVSGTLVAVAVAASPVFAALLVLGTPILIVLLAEQRAAAASSAWQRQIFLELPVIAEQLGMLMSAGWSLGSAIQRIADRGRGAVAEDLAIVAGRTRHGLTEVDALREWADLARVDALDRLVAVLALNREATDLDRLITQEARAIRRDAQRNLVEAIERKSQQVWIPVTVAALVPGVLLMGVPFVEALTLFST
jgi:tight adherence protein C